VAGRGKEEEMNLSKQVELLLTEGKHTGSHKFAFLRAVLDYVVDTDPAEGRDLKIPLIYFAEKFLLYYWKMSLYQTQQMTSCHPLKFYRQLSTINEELALSSGTAKSSEENYIHEIFKELKSINHLPSRIVTAINRMRLIVFDHPVVHAKYISMRKKPLNLDFYTYPVNRRTRIEADTYEEFYGKEKTFITIRRNHIPELKAMYYWFEKAVLVAWAEFTDNIPANRQEGKPTGLSLLQIARPDRKSLKPYRKHFRDLGFYKCAYCNERAFDSIDHIIPWRMVKADRFWNMLPICRPCNSAKSDRIWKLGGDAKKVLRESINEIINHLEDYPDFKNQLVDYFIYRGQRVDLGRKGQLKQDLYETTLSRIKSFSSL
jgi:5-methylcytosine-specific restriction endonuclease McrA